MKASMWNQFSTDPNVEKEGVWLDYGDFRIRVTYAGETNKKYAKTLETLTRPHRRQIASGNFSNARSMAILYEVYATAVIMDWETAKGDDNIIAQTIWEKGIQAKDGSLLPVTKENIIAVFKALPKLFLDVREQAESVAVFRADEIEDEGKNL
jgi:hypothetical protein